VRMWNRRSNPAVVLQGFMQNVAPYTKSQIVLWKLNEASGSVILDETSGNELLFSIHRPPVWVTSDAPIPLSYSIYSPITQTTSPLSPVLTPSISNRRRSVSPSNADLSSLDWLVLPGTSLNASRLIWPATVLTLSLSADMQMQALRNCSLWISNEALQAQCSELYPMPAEYYYISCLKQVAQNGTVVSGLASLFSFASYCQDALELPRGLHAGCATRACAPPGLDRTAT